MNRVISAAARRIQRLSARAAAPVYCWRYGLQRVRPCYFVRTTIDDQSVVLDCGLGNNADFSDAIVTRFNARCHGVDPTRKHQASLAAVASRHPDRLRLHPVAVAGSTGWSTFYEAPEHISGSLFEGHVNARGALSYRVRSLSFDDLVKELGLRRIDVLKLDIEGAEYEVLAGMTDETLRSIGQILVEFHHYCVQGITETDTRNVVNRICSLGFQAYSTDRINYLFFRR